jgi:hypothetical protein
MTPIALTGRRAKTLNKTERDAGNLASSGAQAGCLQPRNAGARLRMNGRPSF